MNTSNSNNNSFNQLFLKYQALEASVHEKDNEIKLIREENSTMKKYIQDLENQVSELKRELGLEGLGEINNTSLNSSNPIKTPSKDFENRPLSSSSSKTGRPLSRAISRPLSGRDFSDLETQELKSENQRLIHSIDTIKLETERLQDELLMMQTVSKENSKLRIEISQLQKFSEFLLKFVEKSCSEGEKASLSQLKIYENELKIAYEERMMKGLQNAYSTLDHSAKVAIEKQDRMTKTIEEGNSSLEYVLKELNRLKEQNDNMRRESEASTTRLGRKNQEVSELKKQLVLEREKNEEYSEILHAARMEQVSSNILKSEITSKTSALSHLQQQYNSAQREIKRLKDQLQKKVIPNYPLYVSNSNSNPNFKQPTQTQIPKHNSLDVLSVWNATYNEYSQQIQNDQEAPHTNINTNDLEDIYAKDFQSRYMDTQDAFETNIYGKYDSNDITDDRINKTRLVYDINTPRKDLYQSQSQIGYSSNQNQNQSNLPSRQSSQHYQRQFKKRVSELRNEADQKLSVLSKSKKKTGQLAIRKTTESQKSTTSLKLLSQPLPNSSLKPEIFAPEFGTRYLLP